MIIPVTCAPAREAEPSSPAAQAILALTEHACRYPMGDVTDPCFVFCSAMAEPGSPYCAGHSKLCFNPGLPRGFIWRPRHV